MKRIVKDPDVRKAEIMEAAEKLFKSNGYASTSVEAIIKSAGIAKGTFYYYFKTKQDILKALITEIGVRMETHLNSILNLSTLSAIEKLQLMIRGKEKKTITSSALMKIIHNPENREFQEELNIQGVRIIAPIIAKVFDQGYQEGIFKLKVPVESVQLMLAGSLFVLDSGLFEWTSKQRIKFLKSSQTTLELIAGARKGSLAFISVE